MQIGKSYTREKDGTIQAIVPYKVNNKWKQKSKQGFERVKEANTWIKQTEFQLMQDIKDNIDFEEYTFYEALQIYKEIKKGQLKKSSYETLKSLENSTKELHALEIKKIRPVQITRFIQDYKRKTEKEGYSLTLYLRKFFNFCIKDLKLIRENPVNIIKNTRKDERIKYIDKTLYEQILSGIKKEETRLIIKLLYNTGMRIGEIYGLNQKDIKNNTIYVHQQRNRLNEITSLKTKNSERQIPITTEFYNELKNYKISDIDGYLFPKTRFLTRTLTPYKVSPHCFRHTYATNLVASGINLKVASEIIGDTFDIFINTYVEPSDIETQKAFEQLRKVM